MSLSMAAGPSSSSSPNVFQRQADATESVWLAIGRAAETMGDLERAQKAYERVLIMNPTSWRALTQAAHVCRCREDYPRAVDYFNRAIQIDDKNGDIWSSLGHCFLMQDELQSAYDAYQNALFHLPSPKEDAKLWYGIGILYDRYGSLQHAEEAFSSVLKMDQNFEKADEIYFRLGIIYKQLQRYSESLKCFDQILRNPPHPLSQMDIWFQIGHVYEQQKDYDSARDAWDRVLTEAPNHAKVLQQLGWLYHQSAAPFVNQEVAVQYLTRSLATDPSDAQSWYLLGRAYMTSQKYNKAYEAYQQAVYRDGRNPTFWISIGVLYFQINQFKDALDAYSRAIRLNPYISEVWFDLGSLYESCNQQLKDAMDAYVRAKELDPTNTTVKERLELLNRHLQDPSIPLGAAPPPKDVHPTAYSNFQTQPADAPPPMRIHSNSTRHSPSRHGFSGAGAPLPNGAYQPGPRAHSRHSSPTPMRYGEASHPRGGGDDYRGRGQPQDVEMSDAHDPAYSTSRPGSSRGRRNSSHHRHQQPPSAGGGERGYSAILPPPNHPQNTGPQNVPSMLHHPQAQAQAPGSHRKHHASSGQKASQRSISPSPHPLMRVRGLSPGGGGGGAGAHGPSSSAAGGHYGSYGPSPASRYGGGGGGPNGNYERGRSPGAAAASSASGGAYGATMPADVDANWERERRSYASGGLPPVNHAGHHHHSHPDARGERDDRERLPPGGGGSGGPGVGSSSNSSSIRVKEEPRDKNVRLPPPPPLGGSSSHQQQIQQMQHSNEGPGRRMAHDRHPSDDYDMRPPQSGPYGPGAGSGGPGGGGPYEYERNGAVRNRSPVSGGHGGPNAHSQHQPPHRSERRYDPLHDDRGPPRQSPPFHPGPIRHNEVSPVAYHDERERRRTHDETNAPPYGQQQLPPHHDSNRRRSGRVDKDDAESVSGAEKGSNRKRGPASRNSKKEKDYGYPPYSAGSGVTPQPSSAFSAPPPPPQPTRSPGWQSSSSFPQGESYDNRNRSRASSTSYGQQGPHQRYPSDANSAMNSHRQQPSSAHTPVPPLVPNKQSVSRLMDEEYDDPDASAVGALMGLAGASSRALPASVTSTPATAPPMSSVSTVKGDSQSPVLRPSSQMTTRKRRRSGTASSTEQPPHTSLANSSSATSVSAEPEKKKQRLEGSPGREGSVAMNGARRPSIEDDEEVDQLQREGSEKMQEDPRSPNGAPQDASGPNGDKAGSPPPFRRANTQSSNMEMSNGPPSTGSQDTMRHQTRSPTTPVGSKGPMVTSTSPREKASEERENSRRSASHSHSRSNSMMNGTKASASPVS